MFIKQVPITTYEIEMELQTIAARHGFSPNIIKSIIDGNTCYIYMDDLDTSCLADVYGENPNDIPDDIWNEIRTMVETLLNDEGIEYSDITPYNFIEKDGKIYMIDFGHARYVDDNESISWFVRDFIDGENNWNPDYK